MNRLITTFFSGVLLAASGTVLAQDYYDGPGPRHQRGAQGMPVVERFVRALKRLDLSEEQKESIHAVMQELKTEAGPIMYEMKASHMRLKELIKADEYDEKAVADLAEKEGDLAAERIVVASRALSEVYSTLTDEQRAQLEEMAARRTERRRPYQ